jgi:hypothetical protein
MDASGISFDSSSKSPLSSGCQRPFKTKSGVSVRCGSRVKSACEPCAELYRGDWAKIARSGVFDGPVKAFQFYLLTLTAPSFGAVHRVPRDAGQVVGRCKCGVSHTVADAASRGAALHPASYDYLGQVSWNRDAGVLWDRTRKRLRDRWPSGEFFLVREWQDRGVLHLHLLIRIARVEAPRAAVLGEAARTAQAVSKVDGTVVVWGDQMKCDPFRADGDGAKTIWYLSKALNYVLKDNAREGVGGNNLAWAHIQELGRAARSIRCCRTCIPADCPSRVHDRFGSRSHVVSASRRTKNRTGWSFTGLTRGVQRRLRKEWVDAQGTGVPVPERPATETVQTAAEQLRERARRELEARAAASIYSQWPFSRPSTR